ncbi:hypothetical protein QYM36_017237, partial [Artemia franciscana]
YTITLNIPIPELRTDTSATFILPFTFNLPNTFEEYFVPDSWVINSGRKALYRSIETQIDNFGFDGKSCILRTICEVAEEGNHRHGLGGEVLSVLF